MDKEEDIEKVISGWLNERRWQNEKASCQDGITGLDLYSLFTSPPL
jgi:hypothetical protein